MSQQTATEAELDQIIKGLHWVRGLLETLLGYLELAISVFIELRTIRQSLKANRRPIDWHKFLEDFQTRDEQLTFALRHATCKSFDLGRLVLEIEDPQIRSFLQLVKYRLENLLSEKFGTKFKVKISE